MNLWREQRDDLLAGRTPRKNGGGLTLADLCNHFLTSQLRLLESGELAQRAFDRYKATTDFLIETFGKGASRMIAFLSWSTTFGDGCTSRKNRLQTKQRDPEGAQKCSQALLQGEV